MSNIGTANLPGQLLGYDGTSVGYENWLTEVRLKDDFFAVWNNGNNQLVSENYWNCGVTGGVFSTVTPGTAAHPGIFTLSSSTSSTGNAGIFFGNASSTTAPIIVGGGAIDLYWVIQMPTLSTSGERYIANFGFGDTYGNATQGNGIYFTCADNINSAQWRGITTSASTPTNVDSSTATTTSYTTLRININAAGTLVTFYVNGVSIGTSSTNIPTATIVPFVQMTKSIGSTARTVNIDLFYMYQKLTAAR